jgi:hypothetical protein
MTKNKHFLLISACICALLIIGLAITSGCNKRAAAYNPDFIGTWRTVTLNDTIINQIVRSEIVIEKRDGLYNNTCRDTCEERLCDCISQQAGRAVVSVDKKRLRIGSSSSYSLSIDKEPNEDNNGQWTMIIDGQTYYRQ